MTNFSRKQLFGFLLVVIVVCLFVALCLLSATSVHVATFCPGGIICSSS